MPAFDETPAPAEGPWLQAARERLARLPENPTPDDVDALLDRLVSLPWVPGCPDAGALAQSATSRRYRRHLIAGGPEQGYTALLIDSTNLRSAVRSIRMGRDAHFLRSGLLPGGGVDLLTLAEAAQGGDLAALFSHTPLREAAALGAPLRSGGRLTGFERACDNALMAYLSAARRTPFGEAPVVGYLCAREAELVAIRVVLSGKLAGLSADLLRERLRDTYV